MKFYLTGVSGVGKSTLVEELKKREISGFDIDYIEGLCSWKNKATGSEGIYQYGIGRDWLEAHDYFCDTAKLKQLLNEHKGDLVVSGLASNQDEYLELFDKIFLLRCSPETFISRLNSRKENQFAKEKQEHEHILGWYKNYEKEMLKKGAIPINTDRPLTVIADKIVKHFHEIRVDNKRSIS